MTLLRQGLTELQNGQLAAAQTSLESAEKLEPANPLVASSLAQTYLRLGQKEQALREAGEAEKLGGENPAVLHVLSIFYSEVGDPGRAATLEERFSTFPAADMNATARAATLYLQAGNSKAAADLTGKALATHPQDAQLQLTSGVAQYAQRRFDAATDAFLKTIQLDPTMAQPYEFLGRMLDQTGNRLPEVLASYRAWHEREPENGRACLLLGEALLASHVSGPEAEQLFKRATELLPNDWEAHGQLGQVLEKKHDYPLAAAELERSIQLKADEAETHYHLSRVYDRLGDKAKAAEQRALHAQLTTAENHASGGMTNGRNEPAAPPK